MANINIKLNASALHDIFTDGGYDQYHPFSEVNYYTVKIRDVWEIPEATARELAEQMAVIGTK